MDFIIYENFSDFKENFRDHYASCAKSCLYIDFLKNYKSCYEQVYMEYDFVIGKATETGIFTASLESEDERREREKETYEGLLPKLKFPQNRNLVKKYLNNIQNPITDRDAIWRENDDEIERNYFEVRRKTIRLLKKSIKLERERFMPETKKVEKSRKENSLNDKPTDPNPEILMQGFASIEAQNFFYKLHEYYKDKPDQNPNYWFIYWKMVKDKFIDQDNLKPMMYNRKIKNLDISVSENRNQTEAKALKEGSNKYEMRLEKYNEIKNNFPGLNNIS